MIHVEICMICTPSAPQKCPFNPTTPPPTHTQTLLSSQFVALHSSYHSYHGFHCPGIETDLLPINLSTFQYGYLTHTLDPNQTTLSRVFMEGTNRVTPNYHRSYPLHTTSTLQLSDLHYWKVQCCNTQEQR